MDQIKGKKKKEKDLKARCWQNFFLLPQQKKENFGDIKEGKRHLQERAQLARTEGRAHKTLIFAETLLSFLPLFIIEGSLPHDEEDEDPPASPKDG